MPIILPASPGLLPSNIPVTIASSSCRSLPTWRCQRGLVETSPSLVAEVKPRLFSRLLSYWIYPVLLVPSQRSQGQRCLFRHHTKHQVSDVKVACWSAGSLFWHPSVCLLLRGAPAHTPVGTYMCVWSVYDVLARNLAHSGGRGSMSFCRGTRWWLQSFVQTPPNCFPLLASRGCKDWKRLNVWL